MRTLTIAEVVGFVREALGDQGPGVTVDTTAQPGFLIVKITGPILGRQLLAVETMLRDRMPSTHAWEVRVV